MLPKTPRDLHDRAGECERWAARTADEQSRETLLHVASCWRAMGDADELVAKGSGIPSTKKST
jgi:predicted glycosyl hydrolase (DUF1957 family)